MSLKTDTLIFKRLPVGVPLLNQKNIRKKKQFIYNMRKEFNRMGRTKDALWLCFLSYMGMLNYLGCSFLTEKTNWQLEDYKQTIYHTKTMWHRSRRSGKTLGLSVLAVFFSLINFGSRANIGKVMWRAPATDQLSQAQEWLKRNPFVQYVNGENDVYVFVGRCIDMACLSSGKVASQGASVLIEDEYRDVHKDKVVYDDALRCEAILAEGLEKDKKYISASTGCRLTFFHNQFLSGKWHYLRHTYKECPWITEKFIEEQRAEHPEDPYYVQQEFEAIWVARGDTAFKNVYVVDMKEKTVSVGEEVFKFGDHPFFPLNWTFPTPRKAGVDFNMSSGHYVVVGSDDEEATYVNFERVVWSIPELRAYGHQYSMEIESGPFEMNIECARECSQLNIKCTHQNWIRPVPAQRFKKLMSKMIIIDRWTAPFTLTNLFEAVFENSESRESTSKLKKSSKQHGLDALMHMIHKYNNFGNVVMLSDEEKAYLERQQQNKPINIIMN